MLMDCIFLDLPDETVDPKVTAEFRSDWYVYSIWERLRKKRRNIEDLVLRLIPKIFTLSASGSRVPMAELK